MIEQNLWLSFKEGEKKAFEHVFNAYYDELYRYGLKLSKDKELVKDSIQDLFLKLWKIRDKLKGIEIIRPYLLRSLRNQIIDNIKLKNSSDFSLDEKLTDLIDLNYYSDDFNTNEKITDEVKAKVILALNNLKPTQKEIIYLRYFEELSYETIAIVMEMNIQSVRNSVYKAITVLKELTLLSQFLLMLEKNF